MAMSFYSILSQVEIERLHRGALKVLDEVGVLIESEELLTLLGEYGGRVDKASRRIYYSPAWVENFIQESDKYDWGQHRPYFGCGAGIYLGPYLNPETDQIEPFTEETFRDYIRVAHGLEEVNGIGTLGLPFNPPEYPTNYMPLFEKIYAWKYHCGASGTVQFTGLCPYLIEVFERRAQEQGKRLEEVFSAVGYLITPLRLAAVECEQVLYFRSHGLHMGIGHLLSLGSSTPITIAGAVVMNLAQCLFLGIFHRSLYGGRSLGIGGGTMVMDPRTTTSLYGRPEQIMVSTIMTQIARYYQVPGGSHCGLSDAKEPSVQAGMQKTFSAIASLCSCGSGSIAAGNLSIDELCSSEQMVYDAELASAVHRFIQPVIVNDETCAEQEIAEVGPGGLFIGTEFTAAHFRQEVWQPKIWSGELLQGWMRSGAKSDRQLAKEKIRAILSQPLPEPGLSEEVERDIRAIIARAIAADAANA